MRVLRFFVLGLVISSWAAIGCGGDDGGGDSSSGGSGGAGGNTMPAAGNTGAGSGGAGGTSGSSAGSSAAGTGGTTGGTGGTAGTPVTCGSATCEPSGSRILRPCCMDEGTSTCGVMLAFGGMSCNEIVEADPRCESITRMGITIPSCCTEDNRCGISFAMLGQPGCTSLEEAAMIAMGDGGVSDGGTIDLPAPKACE